MRKVYIYGLVDPLTEQLRYVGKTVQKPADRLSAHCCKTRKKGNHTECWVKSLIKQETKPEMIIIDIVDESNWVFWEQFYIAYYKSIGCRLTNFTEGGDTCNLGKRWKIKVPYIPRNTKSVILNNEIEFKSVKECADYLGTRDRTIVRNLKKGISYKGNILRYKGHTNEVVIKKMNLPITAISINEEKEFSSAIIASKELNIDYSGIMKCLKGNLKHIKNIKFRYK